MKSSANTPVGQPHSFLSTANKVDMQSLGLIQRVLLVSDGTLTDIVEAIHSEPIRLVKLSLHVSDSAEAIPELDVRAGDAVMRREILLQGASTGTNYVFAESLIVLDALPPKLREELVTTDRPLGRLWVEHQLETRKEILRVWREPSDCCAASYFEQPRSLLARAYRVFSGRKPIMRISEYFPDR